MAAIRKQIQPVFKDIWAEFAPKVAAELGKEMHIHIAQHLRRTTNPPTSTWSAIAMGKRGYKGEAHFQLGIWGGEGDRGGYVFMYLSLIDNPKEEQRLAEALLESTDFLKALPADFIYSVDHTKREVFPLGGDLEKDIIRFRDIKKAEFEVGRVIPMDSKLWQDSNALRQYLWQTIGYLLPLHKRLYG